ncbi:hypothetical protein PI124_g756 [Phytophthora idaei]|nr:hypothetical protein PI125_g5920 [Phytophthora idaei]KAG3162944.1 hypothetical protein PI126_g5774 [Phytophthora idaei]KAG3254693.1 hypothetical protein PI124_g756 [Phytophthora idaei]
MLVKIPPVDEYASVRVESQPQPQASTHAATTSGVMQWIFSSRARRQTDEGRTKQQTGPVDFLRRSTSSSLKSQRKEASY